MCLVLLHVEMRAKTVRQVKIYFFCTPFLPPKLLTKSTLTRAIFRISSESKIGSKPEKVTGYLLTTLTATINQSKDIGIMLIINCLFSSFVDFYHMKCQIQEIQDPKNFDHLLQVWLDLKLAASFVIGLNQFSFL